MFAIHDSFRETFRNPFGAILVGGKAELSIFINNVASVRLIYIINGEKKYLLTSSHAYRYFGKAGYLHSCTLDMPELAGQVWYAFEIEHNGQVEFYCGSHGEGYLSDRICQSYQITVYKECELPVWYKNGVAYQIFPDRFARGGATGGLLRVNTHTNKGQAVYIHDNWNEDVCFMPRRYEKHYNPCDFFCGDLYGIEERMDYIKSFYVSCLYLNPIFESPSNHRYDTSNYMKVDGILGGDEAFFSLRETARRMNVHIMLDGVFSHTGADSIYFNRYRHFDSDGAANTKNSEYFSWYDFSDYPEKYKCWWGFEELPEVDEDNESYREYIAQVVSKWCVSWRLDVADELTDEFIKFFYACVKRVDNDAVIIGEVWEDASDKHSKGKRREYTDGNVLDGVMNYPLREWICSFLLNRITAQEFEYDVRSMWENYPREFLRGTLNILSSHDTVRILTVLCGAPERDALSRNEQRNVIFSGIELTKGEKNVILAMILQFALPGVPCIYYGDEQGMQGMADPFCRRPFSVAEDNYIEKRCRALCKAKTQNNAFSGEAEVTAYTEDVIIIRRCQHDSQVFCIVNRADEQVCIKLECDDEKPVYKDALNDNVYCTYNGVLELIIEPRGGAVLCSL